MSTATDSPGARAAGSRFAGAALLALIAAASAIHLQVLDEWWRIDDPQLLLHAIRNTPLESLFSPSHWRTLQTVSFQPMLSISFDLDYFLFGVRPGPYYAHQLLAGTLTSLLVFVLLLRPCGSWFAAATAAIVGFGPAMAYTSNFIQLRHYAEGALFAAAALVCWQRGTSRERSGWLDTGAALLYLVAMLEKEVFAPLPLFFLADAFASRLPFRSVVRRMLPSVIVAVVYVPWRVYMLGGLGGYGGPVRPGSVGTVLAGSVGQLLPSHFGLFLALVALALAVGLAKAPRATLLLVPASAVFVSLPLLGVAGLVEVRYGVIPLTLVTVLCGAAFSRLPAKGGAVAIALLAGVELLSALELHRNVDREQERGQREGLYVWNEPENAPVLFADSAGWYLTGVGDLRRLAGRGEPPGVVLSRYGLSSGEVDASRIVRVSDNGSSVGPLAAPVREAVALDLSKRDDSIPLDVDVSMKDFALEWRLGPPEGSKFVFLTHPLYDEYEIPPAGTYRVPAATEEAFFRIRRESGDGRWTLSPVLKVPGPGERAAWKR